MKDYLGRWKQIQLSQAHVWSFEIVIDIQLISDSEMSV